MVDKEPEMPDLEDFQAAVDTTRWRPSPDIENAAIEVMRDVIPLEIRPTEQNFEKFYEKGYNLYKTGHYKEAIPYFEMLSIVNPKQPKYFMALGASYQMLKEYEKAVDFYALCAMLDEYNPIPQYHMAGCMIKMDAPFGALVALEVGYPRCDSSPKYKGLKDRMMMMMERLRKELEEKKAQGLFKDIGKQEPPPKVA